MKWVGLGFNIWMETFYLLVEIFGGEKFKIESISCLETFLRIFIRFYSIVEYTVLIEEVGSSHISPLDN